MPRAATAKPAPADAGAHVPPVIRKSKVGYVVSDGMDKTAVVRVDSITTHRLYKKRVRKSRKFMVHDADNRAQTGDYVRIIESRPTSKRKSWELGDILRAASARVAAEAVEQQIEKQVDAEAEE